jgi:hypothetical protein
VGKNQNRKGFTVRLLQFQTIGQTKPIHLFSHATAMKEGEPYRVGRSSNVKWERRDVPHAVPFLIHQQSYKCLVCADGYHRKQKDTKGIRNAQQRTG